MLQFLRRFFVKLVGQKFVSGLLVFSLALLSGCGSGGGGGGGSAPTSGDTVTPTSGNTVTETVGPAGGELKLSSGETITIPPDALSENVSVLFESKTRPTVPFNESVVEVLGKTLRMTFPSSGTGSSFAVKQATKWFGKKVEVTFSMSSTKELMKNVSCRFDYFDIQNKKIETHTGGVKVDSSGRVSCFVPAIQVKFDIVEINLISYEKFINGARLYLKPALLRTVSDNEHKNGCPTQDQDLKIPLILIHGFYDDLETATDLHLKNPELGWDNFVNFQTKSPQCLNSNYEIFRFKYISTNSIDSNGALIAQKIQAIPSLSNRTDIVIIGHSMGGLVARSYIVDHGGAEKVHKLITLATPHHGSHASSKALRAADWKMNLDTPGAKDLAWDNYDLVFNHGDLANSVGFSERILFGKGCSRNDPKKSSCLDYLQLLNERDFFLDKYLYYGSAVFTPTFFSRLNVNKNKFPGVKISVEVYDDGIKIDRPGFLVGDGDTGGYFFDGAVPLESAFHICPNLNCQTRVEPTTAGEAVGNIRSILTSSNHRFFQDYDHSQMWKGVPGSDRLFLKIKSDLDEIEQEILLQSILVQPTLTMTKNGTGNGQITISPSGGTGGRCSGECVFFAPGTLVTLTAREDLGSTFTQWSGCTSISGTTCNVTMDGDQSVTASFELSRVGTGGTGDPNGTIATAQALTLPMSPISGAIDPLGDVDFFRFSASAGDRVTIDIDAAVTGSGMDSFLRLFDGNGVELVSSDDDAAPGEGFSRDSYISHVLATTGNYFISVSAFLDDSTGPYSLAVAVSDGATGPPAGLTAAISSPSNGTSFSVGQDILFQGTGGSSYSWQFGDGAISPLQSPTYSYSTANTYNVSLTVFDASGGQNTTSISITVSSVVSNPTLTVNTNGGAGTGMVNIITPTGINCGTTCSPSFSPGTSVTLGAVADTGSTFTGWTGACTGTGDCILTMIGNQSVTAMFNAAGGGTTGTWGAPRRIEGSSLFGGIPALSMNLSGQAIVTWVEPAISVKSSRFSPGLGWSISDTIWEENNTLTMSLDVAIDAGGSSVFVGMETEPGPFSGNFKVRVNRHVDGQGLEIVKVLSDHAMGSFLPQVTVDQSGNAFIAWAHPDFVNGDHDFMVSRREIGQEWETPTIISSGIGSQSIVSDAAGNAMAVWIDTVVGGGIMSRRFSPEFGWGSPEVVLGDTPSLRILNFYPFIDIHMNSNGNAVLGFRAAVNFENTLFMDALFVMVYTPGLGWSSPKAVSLEGDLGGSRVEVAISENGSASIIYTLYSGEDTLIDNSSVLTGIWTLYGRHYTLGGGWAEEQTISIGQNTAFGLTPKISMDGSGGAVVVWHSYNGVNSDIRASSYVLGSGWQQPQSLQSINPDSLVSSLPVQKLEVEVDVSGRAIAVWGRPLGGVWVSRLE